MRGYIPKRRFLIGAAGLTMAVLGSGSLRSGPSDAGPEAAQAVPHTAQSNTQHGYTVTLDRVESCQEGTRLHVVLENQSNEKVYFYDVNAEIWQGEKRYEPEHTFGSSAELPSEVPPGSQAEGVILFPELAPGGKEAVIRFQRPAHTTDDSSWNLVEFRWPLPLPAPIQAGPVVARVAPSGKASPRIAIIKADDMVAPSAIWDQFITASAKRGIKVSIGIICDSLQNNRAGYFEWLRSRQMNDGVEFWSHGWDHQRLGEGRAVSEYNGSGYDYQKKHLTDSQEIMRKVLGDPPVAFGTPWNEFDRDTVRVVNEDKNVRLFFGHKEGIFEAGKVVVRMFEAETDGTGNPDFAKFQALYESQKDRLNVIALQFHPSVFQERSFVQYERILDFLVREGWTFLLPQEYLELLDH